MEKFIINIVCLIFVNFCADIFWAEILLNFLFLVKYAEETSYDIFTTALLFLSNAILVIGHFFVLPICYKIMEKRKYFEISQKFIKLLKNSNIAKFVTLLLAFILFPPFMDFYNISERIILQLIFSLLGSYIVLFIYWWIEDKIKARKQKSIE